MTTEKIALSGVQETMLATLYGKAMESRSADPVLVDEQAEQAVDRIEYDFSRLKVTRNTAVSAAVRSRYLDDWARSALAELPDATVLHLGCGLDSRVYRLDPPPTVRWYDVDYPDVVALRRRLYPERPGYHLIASSVTDPGWLAEVPDDRFGVVIAEGLTMYLTREETGDLFERLTYHLPGGVLMFDAWNSLGMRAGARQGVIKASGAKLGGWGIDHPHDVELLAPGLTFVAEQTFFDIPELGRYGWPVRLACRTMNRIPAMRNMGRLLRYRF
ncbi:class I SAM-dependent methyltransferase [Actinoallomurus vinaceus]|uniref:Class I SAM-dependent methyltransferase n=1 Tax=Actinoallomurus vinaceus TaxID=1080074 RepID=A0ABP8U5M9_9ACTN